MTNREGQIGWLQDHARGAMRVCGLVLVLLLSSGQPGGVASASGRPAWSDDDLLSRVVVSHACPPVFDLPAGADRVDRHLGSRHCWAGWLPATTSVAVADWSARVTVMIVGGLYGP